MSKRTSDRTAPQELRRQLFVAPQAQGDLLARIVLYCVATALISTALCCVAASSTDVNTRWLGASFFGLALVLPLALYDAARVTNRVVGPLTRAQRALRQLANGDAAEPVTLRGEPDYWDDWIYDFNRMLTQIQSRSARNLESDKEQP